jgi:hypothetical protein
MKTLIFLLAMVLAGTVLSAQDQGPIPKISLQITNYFSFYPRENVFLMTDKVHYKPGETIWFRAFTAEPDKPQAADEISKLNVSLFDKAGKAVVKDVFKLSNGSTVGDLKIPADLVGDNYFLVAYSQEQSSLEQVSITKLKIDPEYSNQWVVEAAAKDSISISGKKNELLVVLHDVSGVVQKNEQLRYQIKNGSEVIEKDKLKTDENGKVTIPFTIPAKTNGEPFICELSDYKDEWKHEVFLPSNLDPVVIKFYPEGGNLIAGVPTRIGFTAFNKWGIPVDVEGTVLNQEGEHVTPAKTLTKGLGLFSVINLGQQKFKLLLSGTTGQNQSFELPAPTADGLALSVIKTDAEFIYANLIYPDKQKHAVALTITHGNNVYWAGDMEINGVGRLKIPADQLPQGINLLSAFSKEGNLLAERIIYRDNKQQLKISVQPEKTNLPANGKMTVKVRLTDENNQPVSGNVAVSVADKFRSNTDKPQIEEYLQIESEVETPFSLFPEAFKDKINNAALLDVFLIANRLKGFDWVKIRQFKPENATYINTANFRISGFVTDKNGIKINKAKVSLVNNKNMQLHTTTTNSEGIFSFPNLYMSNVDDFSTKATDSEGKRELKVNLIKNLEGQISVYIADNMQKYSLINSETVANESYFTNNEDLFPKAPKVLKTNTQGLDNQRKLLSSATNIMDVIKTIKPFKIVGNQIVFFGSENSLNYQGGALIVLDGQQMGTDIGTVQNLSPSDIDHINVSTNPMDIQKYTGLNSVGVIEIFQKKAQVTETKTPNEAAEKRDGEFRIANAFPTEPVNPKRDNRTTLLWIPDQNVDQTGQFEFEVTTGKVVSDFVIEVQGTTPDGRVGSGRASFSVVK